MGPDEQKQLKIGLDFDGTISEDPELWRRFINLAKGRGHEVKIVTFRFGVISDFEHQDIAEFCKQAGVGAIFTNHVQKAECYKADIWIDDMPEVIPTNTNLLIMSKNV